MISEAPVSVSVKKKKLLVRMWMLFLFVESKIGAQSAAVPLHQKVPGSLKSVVPNLGVEAPTKGRWINQRSR